MEGESLTTRPSVTKLLIAATTDAEMRYAAGISITDPFILVDDGKRRTLLLSKLECGRAHKELKASKRHRVLSLEPFYGRVKKQLAKETKRRAGLDAKSGKRAKKTDGKGRRGSMLARIAAQYLKERRIRRVEMPRNAWAIHVEQLRSSGIKVELAPSSLYPSRIVKTPAEIKEIMNVRDATVAAMERCIAIVKKSTIAKNKELKIDNERVTSDYLRYEARAVLLRYGCEASELIISHGAQTAYPHDQGSGPIKAGEPILLDFFPRSSETGYWFDMTRTVCKGKPAPELQRLYKAVQEAQDAGLALVKDGVKTGAIHKAVEEVFARHGYKTTANEGFIHSTGHGVGLEIHEAPSISEKGEEVLRAGHVITIEPGLYYRKAGGVRLEDTVLVTTTGHKNMTRLQRVLVL